MPTSAPGNDAPARLTLRRLPIRRASPAGRTAAGFTMIELLIVIALIAVASSVVSLALRDPAAARLDQEAVRLSALLESARAEARASALPVRWEPTTADAGGETVDGFRFVGLPPGADLPTHWLTEGMSARIVGATAVQLGPEPVIAAQRIVLQLERQQLVLATDGLSPFSVEGGEPGPSAPALR